MTTRRSSSPSASPAGNKRQKIFRACTTCVTSKTRCEDVTPDGCSLCRRRGRVCSLAAIASALEGSGVERVESTPRSANGHGNGYSPVSAPTPRRTPRPEMEELQVRLAEAERRVARTEAAMAELAARLDGPERERREQREREPQREPETLPADAYEVQVTGPLRFGTRVLYRLDEAMFSVGSTRVYPDPVVRGVVPAAHVELAWHAFKARISALLPLPPFLAVSTPVPQHGFVVIAALHHVPSAYSAALEPLLNECIMLAMASAASVDVMLALLIMSLAPLPPDDGTHKAAPATPSAYRLIALAYQMGQSMGYETMAEAALQRGGELNREWFGEHLWSLQLWAAIVNRFCLLSLMNGQIARLPHRIAARLPALARDSVEMCNDHLRAEAVVIDIFEPVALKLCRLEHAAEYHLEEVRSLQTVWKDAVDQATEFGRSDQPPSVQRDALCLQFALGVRIASLTTWIPSPLRDARELALPSLSGFPTIMSQMLDMIAADDADPASYPSSTTMLAAAALICFRRAVQFVRVAYRQSHTGLIDGGRLDEAESRLVRLSFATRFFITEANKLLEEMPYPRTWADAAAPLYTPPTEALPHAPHFDFDIMNWDFSLLYPDLASFQRMMEQEHGV